MAEQLSKLQAPGVLGRGLSSGPGASSRRSLALAGARGLGSRPGASLRRSLAGARGLGSGLRRRCLVGKAPALQWALCSKPPLAPREERTVARSWDHAQGASGRARRERRVSRDEGRCQLDSSPTNLGGRADGSGIKAGQRHRDECSRYARRLPKVSERGRLKAEQGATRCTGHCRR
jgi:hypothetical protein